MVSTKTNLTATQTSNRNTAIGLRIVYVPGLGDSYDPVRRVCLRIWQWYGARVTMVPMHWHSDEAYAQKRARLEAVIDDHAAERIVLLGESAGGSMVLAVYADQADRLAGVATLCGKNTRADQVGQAVYERNPAFYDAMQAVEAATPHLSAEQQRRFLSVVPWFDETVPVHETLLPGCRRLTLPAIGHVPAILLMLTLYAPLIVRHLRHRA